MDKQDLQSLEQKADKLLNSWISQTSKMEQDKAFSKYADEYCREPLDNKLDFVDWLLDYANELADDYTFGFYMENQFEIIDWKISYDKKEVNRMLNKEQG